jgi:hypothetical protein
MPMGAILFVKRRLLAGPKLEPATAAEFERN